MKKKVLFSIALAGLMLGSCSKDVIDNGGNGTSWNENGEGYVSLAVNLPTGSGSRANGSFGDGEGKEYAVKDAILMLFSNANADNEADATFKSAYTLNLGNWENNSSDQITSTARIVQKINEIADDNVYALVVLNPNNIIQVNQKAEIVVNRATYNAQSNLKLEDLNEKIAAITTDASNPVWKNNGYLMSNSPLYSAKVESDSPSGTSSTLVKIEKKNIFPTYEQASNVPAGTIFVERVQAKVQVFDLTTTTPNNNKFTITASDGTLVTYYYTLNNWEIDNYNTKTRLTRKFTNTWAGYSNSLLYTANYRFVDDEVVKTGCGYRTYWGEDVNYANTVSSPALTKQEKSATPTVDNTFGNYEYCFENTSGTTQPLATEVTRIIVKAQLGKQNGTYVDFFLVNNDRSTIYINDAVNARDGSIQKRIKAYVLADQGVQEEIAKSINTGNSFTDANLTVTLNISDNNSGILNNKNDITVALQNEGNIGIGGTEKTNIETAIKAALYAEDQSGVENKINFDYYKGGVCYYDAYIRHFNDDEAPLEKTDGTKAGVEDKNLLGRYGVLRNNWYVLNVNSVKGIGDSTVPVIPSEPVDKEELYLSVEINIMPWVMREQNVDL